MSPRRLQCAFAVPLLVLTGFTAAFAPSAHAADADSSAADSAKAEKPWRVEAAHGPVDTVAFTTAEGTWLSLDVHPDGKRIVFSLLGDLYLLPIAGGKATRITSGPAYDVQPRFSRDGKWIAFASDRGGLENLWVCDLEGGNARQVSSEKTYQVNDPAWSPDGEYLLGRKRVTDQSSLGSTELWMWHLRGGDGVRVTKKDEQPDAADAAFSNDGRFIYFSARESRYRYDRDVYEGIYQIKRFDRVTGQRVPMTGEFGGAAAPALSPDGTQMAYVRRVDAKTRLEVMDLATGRTRLVADGLTRDNQQGFTFHGVFPGYAWTPDGRSIVATAGGRIWRWDVASGRRTAIPFEARVEQQVHEALRFRRDIAPDQVRATVVRWPVETPDGRSLIFSALGKLWTMPLSGGTPRRLTSGADHEFCPSLSPDGRFVAYVTWNDREGGHVWTMPAGGGRATRLTRHSGQYAHPAFSADGRRVVYLRGSGATFRGHDLGSELWSEIFWVEARGGESHYVIGTESGTTTGRFTRPTFSADGERIWYLESGDGKPGQAAPQLLVSVKLDGTDKRRHAQFKNAAEALVSPDGRWVAFSERENAYVAALPRAGDQTIEIGTKSAGVPIVRLSNTGGAWLSWANRGRTLGWSYGSTYHRIDIEKAVPMPVPEDAAAKGKDGKDAKKKDGLPESQAVAIDLRLPRAKPSGIVAYTGARIVTMKGDEVIERGTVLVENDRIRAVGADGAVEVPVTAKVVDVLGRTIIPGLVDAHAHLHYSAQDILPQRPWKYHANLAYGVTTTHDPSATSFETFEQSTMVEAGLLTGPRIFSTGSILYGADAPWTAEVQSLDDARNHIRRMKSQGAFTVKSYMHPSRKNRQWIIQAAREESVMVMPEGGGDLEADMTMVLDGHTTIEHSLPFAPLYADVVTLMARSRTAYVPTLLVAYGGHSGDKWFHQHYDIFKDERLKRFVPARVLEPIGRVRDLMAPDGEWHHIDVASAAKDVMRAGGMVCLGAHGQMQGVGPHWEMWAFAQGGMTPLEALRVSTLMPARALGMEHAIGSLEPGKLADFVVLTNNPLDRIENSDSVEFVVKNGRRYALDELALDGPRTASRTGGSR